MLRRGFFKGSLAAIAAVLFPTNGFAKTKSKELVTGVPFVRHMFVPLNLNKFQFKDFLVLSQQSLGCINSEPLQLDEFLAPVGTICYDSVEFRRTLMPNGKTRGHYGRMHMTYVHCGFNNYWNEIDKRYESIVSLIGNTPYKSEDLRPLMRLKDPTQSVAGTPNPTRG